MSLFEGFTPYEDSVDFFLRGFHVYNRVQVLKRAITKRRQSEFQHV